MNFFVMLQEFLLFQDTVVMKVGHMIISPLQEFLNPVSGVSGISGDSGLASSDQFPSVPNFSFQDTLAMKVSQGTMSLVSGRHLFLLFKETLGVN